MPRSNPTSPATTRQHVERQRAWLSSLTARARSSSRAAPDQRIARRSWNCSIMAVRSEGRPRALEAAVVVPRTVSAKTTPPGTTAASRWPLQQPSRAPRGAYRHQHHTPTPPDLDNRSAPSGQSGRAAGATWPPSRPRARNRPAQARRDRAPRTRPEPTADNQRSSGGGVGRGARLLDLAQLLIYRRGDRVDLGCVELLDVGAHQAAIHSRAKTATGRRTTVGRGAVVRLLRQTAEDRMDVGARSRSTPTRPAPNSPRTGARHDRREVGPPHRRCTRLLRRQRPLEVAVDRSLRHACGRSGRVARVVLPTSMSSASGVRGGDGRARSRTQSAAADAHGRAPRLLDGHELASVVGTLAADRRRRLGGVEHERRPLALRPEARRTARRSSFSRRRPLDRHVSTQARRERLAIPPHFERARERRANSPVDQAALVFAPPMSTPSHAVVPVIDRTARRFTLVRGAARTLPPARQRPALARARFRPRLGLDGLYVADLDTITGAARAATTRIIRTLAARPARSSTPASGSRTSARAARARVHRVVVGTSTLTGPDPLDRCSRRFPASSWRRPPRRPHALARPAARGPASARRRRAPAAGADGRGGSCSTWRRRQRCGGGRPADQPAPRRLPRPPAARPAAACATSTDLARAPRHQRGRRARRDRPASRVIGRQELTALADTARVRDSARRHVGACTPPPPTPAGIPLARHVCRVRRRRRQVDARVVAPSTSAAFARARRSSGAVDFELARGRARERSLASPGRSARSPRAPPPTTAPRRRSPPPCGSTYLPGSARRARAPGAWKSSIGDVGVVDARRPVPIEPNGNGFDDHVAAKAPRRRRAHPGRSQAIVRRVGTRAGPAAPRRGTCSSCALDQPAAVDARDRRARRARAARRLGRSTCSASRAGCRGLSRRRDQSSSRIVTSPSMRRACASPAPADAGDHVPRARRGSCLAHASHDSTRDGDRQPQNSAPAPRG